MITILKKYITAAVIVLIPLFIIGCFAGQAPSFGNFMGDGGFFSTGTALLGDVYDDEPFTQETDYEYGTLLLEPPYSFSFGGIRGRNFKAGLTLGLSGFSPLIGFKTKSLGCMGWGNFSPYARTGGIALIEMIPYLEELNFGLAQYYAINSASVWEKDWGLFKNFVDEEPYHEIGLGMFSLFDLGGGKLSLDYRLGKELNTDNWRHYFSATAMIDWDPFSWFDQPSP